MSILGRSSPGRSNPRILDQHVPEKHHVAAARAGLCSTRTAVTTPSWVGIVRQFRGSLFQEVTVTAASPPKPPSPHVFDHAFFSCRSSIRFLLEGVKKCGRS